MRSDIVVEGFSALAQRIRSTLTANDSRLVAVDGPSGSGKSVFSARLARALDGAPIVSTDDFVSWPDLDGWWPRLEREVILPLLSGQEARYQQRDWENDPLGDSLGSWRHVAPSPIVLIEGVTSARQAANKFLTYVVWITAPRDVRLRRGLTRDGEQMRSTWLDWMRREDAFFAADRTTERANILVDGAPTIAHDSEREFVHLRLIHKLINAQHQ